MRPGVDVHTYNSRVKIYTKTGDGGDTSLFDNTRVSKADSLVDAYGEVDELNACLGAARAADVGGDVAAALESLGASVSVWDHGDSFYDHDSDGNAFTPGSGEAADYGFLQLLEEMVFIRDSMIAQFDNPTRVVVVAHSHGVVWCHTAMHLISDLPVDVLIDLDGDVESWDHIPAPGVAADSWNAVIADYNGQTGFSWAFDITQARDGWTVPGMDELQDIEDVIPSSADLALEVWANGVLLRDEDPNVRLDGTIDDVLLLQTGESHEGLARSGNEGITWAVEQLLEYYGQ